MCVCVCLVNGDVYIIYDQPITVVYKVTLENKSNGKKNNKNTTSPINVLSPSSFSYSESVRVYMYIMWCSVLVYSRRCVGKMFFWFDFQTTDVINIVYPNGVGGCSGERTYHHEDISARFRGATVVFVAVFFFIIVLYFFFFFYERCGVSARRGNRKRSTPQLPPIGGCAARVCKRVGMSYTHTYIYMVSNEMNYSVKLKLLICRYHSLSHVILSYLKIMIYVYIYICNT